MIPKRDKNTDISKDIAAGKELKEKIVNLAQEATRKFMGGANLNVTVADISDREGFNRLQIQRLIEETNTIAYNKKYETVKKANDRRISFELAELRKVLDQMGSSAPGEIDNPNQIKGRPGDGEIKKEASFAQLHRPHQNTELLKEKMMAKTASHNEKYKEKENGRLVREYSSDIFKIANSIVMSHRLYKNAGHIVDALANDMTLPIEVIEDIEKKANDIASKLIETKKVVPSFRLNFKREKTASYFLGDYSLLKEASFTNKLSMPKIASTQSASTYEDLIKLAKNVAGYAEELRVLHV